MKRSQWLNSPQQLEILKINKNISSPQEINTDNTIPISQNRSYSKRIHKAQIKSIAITT